MLILGRKEEESILIGDHIRIKILSIKKGVVRLGVTAPNSIPVDREEVRRAKQAGDPVVKKFVDYNAPCVAVEGGFKI